MCCTRPSGVAPGGGSRTTVGFTAARHDPPRPRTPGGTRVMRAARRRGDVHRQPHPARVREVRGPRLGREGRMGVFGLLLGGRRPGGRPATSPQPRAVDAMDGKATLRQA